MLQRLPGELERHPLLRIDVVGLHLRQREELGVEALDVRQVAAAGARLGHPVGDPRLVEELLPAALGQVGDGVAALEQRLPHLVGGVQVAGEAGADAHDGDVRRRPRRRPRPVELVVDGALVLGLALDDHRRQRLDGRVPERDGGRQRDAGEVLDVAGHRHRVARRQTELDHRRGLVDARPADCPVALRDPVAQPLTQLGDRHVGAGRPVLCGWIRRCRVASAAGCELSSVSVIFTVLCSPPLRPVSTRRMMPVSPSHRGSRWRSCRCAGCRRGTRPGRRGGRSCRSRSAGSRPQGSAARRAR